MPWFKPNREKEFGQTSLPSGAASCASFLDQIWSFSPSSAQFKSFITLFTITMEGKVALITGASSGIGAGTAVFLAGKGCHLALTGRNEKKLQRTVQQCVEAGAAKYDVLLIVADLQKEEDMRQVIDKTIQKYDRLDILINNAGLALPGSLEKMSMSDFDTIFNVNVRSVFYLTQLAVPHLVKSKGNVVCVSSGLGSIPIGGDAIAYSMSKAALDHFVRISAVDLAPRKVRVNGVNPGYVKTGLTGNMGRGAPDLRIEQIHRRVHALGRAGTVEEIARAIAFLADDTNAAFITGVNLPVDGGFVLMGPIQDV